MITEFSTLPKKIYYVQTAEDCTVLDADGEPLAEISAPGGYFPGIGAPDAATGTVTFSVAVKRVIGPFDLAPQLQLTLLGLLGGNAAGLPAGYTPLEYLESDGNQWIDTEFAPTTSENFQASLVVFVLGGIRFAQGSSCAFCSNFFVTPIAAGRRISGNVPQGGEAPPLTRLQINLRPDEVSFLDKKYQISSFQNATNSQIEEVPRTVKLFAYSDGANYKDGWIKGYIYEFFATFADQKTHMIPALDESGAPCFYCVARKLTFYNMGTGDFSYPGKELAVSTFSLRRPVTYAQLTAHGLRRLYRVPRGYNGTKEEYAVEYGFKPLVETPQPAEGYWVPQWRETAEEIVLDWVETEPPAEELEYA